MRWKPGCERRSFMCWCFLAHACSSTNAQLKHTSPVRTPTEHPEAPPRWRDGLALVQLCPSPFCSPWPGGAGLAELPGGCSGRGHVHSSWLGWQSHLWPLVTGCQAGQSHAPGWREQTLVNGLLGKGAMVCHTNKGASRVGRLGFALSDLTLP